MEMRLINSDKIEDSWKWLLEIYALSSQFDGACSLVISITAFGISLFSKEFQIKKLLELHKKTSESLKRMTDTVIQALKYTNIDRVATFHTAVERTIKEAASIPLQLDTLQTFTEQIVPELVEKQTVLQDLELAKRTYLDTELASFGLFVRLAPLITAANSYIDCHHSKYIYLSKGTIPHTI